MVLAILQARSSSTRLPGKVMLDLCGQPMLARQIERVRRSSLIDRLVVATSDAQDDDRLEQLCRAIGVDCYRGSLNDVLDRFYQATTLYKAETIVRLTGDCPLIDPMVIDRVVQQYLDSNSDYVSNVIKPTYPDGLDVEVFSRAALKQAWESAHKKSEREHVTPYILNNPDQFNLANCAHTEDFSSLRWTVDEPEDFEFVKAVYERLYQSNPSFGMDEILALLANSSELSQLNTRYKRNEGLAKSLAEDEVLE